MITSVRKYVTSDGVEHYSYDRAKEHEKTIDVAGSSVHKGDWVQFINKTNGFSELCVGIVEQVGDFGINFTWRNDEDILIKPCDGMVIGGLVLLSNICFLKIGKKEDFVEGE